ncbi:MAG: hypothetical protein SOT19_09055 [Muribaculaceae bacterium]|nr:hypothetical protein [Muribaculaceae bacterium]
MKNRIAYNDSHDGFILDLFSYLKPLTNTQLGFQPWNTDPNKRSEARMDYLIRTFQILTADFNGDYIDELVIVIDGDLWVYDGAAAVRPRFDWNICWYKYTLNGQTFPVVNYIVRKH